MKQGLARLDAAWTRLEVGLACLVAGALVVSLLAWVGLKGLAAQTSGPFVAGAVLRAVLLAAAAGALAHRLGRGPAVTAFAALLGATGGVLLRDVGVAWANNVLGWAQDGSSLTLVGGLRGLSTRLTLWLVFLGASLATAQGRHLAIDGLARLLGPWRRGASMLGGVVTVAACAVAAWGFFDFLAIDAFSAPAGATPREKSAATWRTLGADLHLVHRQLALDLTVAPRVLSGTRWDTALTSAEWNAWLEAGDFGAGVDVGALRDDSGGTHVPLASVGATPPRGLLVKPFALIVPFGLVMLCLRLVLWLLRGAPVDEGHGPAEPAA
ncbi:MAG: TRAP transporter small permease subunit [Myxococcaceae bacterium]|nr:TRAP transporter small permease subunit [Myxococcaceae bacterium]